MADPKERVGWTTVDGRRAYGRLSPDGGFTEIETSEPSNSRPPMQARRVGTPGENPASEGVPYQYTEPAQLEDESDEDYEKRANEAWTKVYDTFRKHGALVNRADKLPFALTEPDRQPLAGTLLSLLGWLDASVLTGAGRQAVDSATFDPKQRAALEELRESGAIPSSADTVEGEMDKHMLAGLLGGAAGMVGPAAALNAPLRAGLRAGGMVRKPLAKLAVGGATAGAAQGGLEGAVEQLAEGPGAEMTAGRGAVTGGTLGVLLSPLAALMMRGGQAGLQEMRQQPGIGAAFRRLEPKNPQYGPLGGLKSVEGMDLRSRVIQDPDVPGPAGRRTLEEPLATAAEAAGPVQGVGVNRELAAQLERDRQLAAIRAQRPRGRVIQDPDVPGPAGRRTLEEPAATAAEISRDVQETGAQAHGGLKETMMGRKAAAIAASPEVTPTNTVGALDSIVRDRAALAFVNDSDMRGAVPKLFELLPDGGTPPSGYALKVDARQAASLGFGDERAGYLVPRRMSAREFDAQLDVIDDKAGWDTLGKDTQEKFRKLGIAARQDLAEQAPEVAGARAQNELTIHRMQGARKGAGVASGGEFDPQSRAQRAVVEDRLRGYTGEGPSDASLRELLAGSRAAGRLEEIPRLAGEVRTYPERLKSAEGVADEAVLRAMGPRRVSAGLPESEGFSQGDIPQRARIEKSLRGFGDEQELSPHLRQMTAGTEAEPHVGRLQTLRDMMALGNEQLLQARLTALGNVASNRVPLMYRTHRLARSLASGVPAPGGAALLTPGKLSSERKKKKEAAK
jgi:hypothetical protein